MLPPRPGRGVSGGHAGKTVPNGALFKIRKTTEMEESRFEHRPSRRDAACRVVGLLCLITLVWLFLPGTGLCKAASLDQGHRVLLETGLQIHGMAYAAYTGNFDTDRWAESHFTGINTCYATSTFPDRSNMQWGRILFYTDSDIQPYEYVYESTLTRLQISDEQDITDPTELANIAAITAGLHTLHPDIIVHTNQGGNQFTTAAVRSYMQQAQPDMLMFDTYPFMGYVPGGSPTQLYEDLEKYRMLGLEGNDGTGTRPIPTGLYTQTYIRAGHTVTGSEINLNRFSAMAFGYKLLDSYVYETWPQYPAFQSALFVGMSTDNPTQQFYDVAEANRQCVNLGPALVRLLSTDVRMEMGRHESSSVTVDNSLPGGVSQWDASAGPYITNVSATNPGSRNNGLEGDVILGYFKALDSSFADPGHEDDVYFMVVNGLSDQVASAVACRQQIRLDFDFGSSGIDTLLRLSRDTGEIEEVTLTHDGGTRYYLELPLDGGVGDLFKFNNGGSFIVCDQPGPIRTWDADATGEWKHGANWDGLRPPDYTTHTAVFGSAITSSRTVTVDTAVTVKAIRFDNANTYAVSGTGSVNMEADIGNAQIEVIQGDHEFQAPVNLNSNTDANIAASSSLAFNNALNLGGNALTKTGEGTLFVNNRLTAGDGSVIGMAGTIAGSCVIGGSLANVSGTVAPGGSLGTLVVKGSFGQGSGGTLEIELAGTGPVSSTCWKSWVRPAWAVRWTSRSCTRPAAQIPGRS